MIISRTEGKEAERPVGSVEVTGSPRALWDLFANPPFLPHGVSSRLPKAKRREARLARLDNWTRAMQRVLLRLRTNDAGVPEESHEMRVARKAAARNTPTTRPPGPCGKWRSLEGSRARRRHLRSKAGCQRCISWLRRPGVSK